MCSYASISQDPLRPQFTCVYQRFGHAKASRLACHHLVLPGRPRRPSHQARTSTLIMLHGGCGAHNELKVAERLCAGFDSSSDQTCERRSGMRCCPPLSGLRDARCHHWCHHCGQPSASSILCGLTPASTSTIHCFFFVFLCCSMVPPHAGLKNLLARRLTNQSWLEMEEMKSHGE